MNNNYYNTIHHYYMVTGILKINRDQPWEMKNKSKFCN